MQKTEVNIRCEHHVITNGKIFAIQRQQGKIEYLHVRFFVFFFWNHKKSKTLWSTKNKKWAKIIVDKLNQIESKKREEKHNFWEKI